MKNILYISLTGMTEPLGRSQVLEYLIDLSKENNIYLISFERAHDLGNIAKIKELLEGYAIEWHYLIYSNCYGAVSTVWQIMQAIRLGSRLIKDHAITLVHARSMIPATMGLLLKKRYGVKLLFDIRGFAIDEKVDTGRVNKTSLLYKILKKLDNSLYHSSDHIVTLTHAAKEIVHANLGISKAKITVIPTCANKEVFKMLSGDEKRVFRNSLGYGFDEKIIIHTGTVSGWYDFESEVKLMKEIMRQDATVHFLVLNKNEQPFIQKIFDEYQMPAERVKIASSSFDEVHKYLNIADASLFFIKPSYSKQASAPTKFAENVACHLPSITNGNVGDMGFYLEKYAVGNVVDLESLDRGMEMIASQIVAHNKLASLENDDFERLFTEHFDKEMAVKKYQVIYNQLAQDK